MFTAPLLTTARLQLWQPQPGDHAGLNAINTDPRTLPFLGTWSPSSADTFARLCRNAGSWALYGYGVFIVRRQGSAQIIDLRHIPLMARVRPRIGRCARSRLDHPP